jgi:predicted component of type VI protein secretion system
MKKLLIALILLSMVFSIYACMSKRKIPPLPAEPPKREAIPPPPVVPPPPIVVMPLVWSYGKDAIRLQMQSDPRLNLYDGIPHTLLLCVYQMSDPNAFNQLKDEKDGLPKLLECARFDSSVTSAKRYIMQPEEDKTLSLDRAEGAKYVGIVGGYYLLRKELSVRLFQVPVEETINETERTKTIKPGFLNIQLYLGPQAIHEIKGR